MQLSPVGALFDIERPSSTAGVGCATGPDGGGWLGGSLLRRGWRASTSAQTWSPHPRSSCSAARPCRPSSTEQPGVCKASVRSEAIKPESTRVVSPVTYEDSRLGAPAPHCIPATSPRRMRQGGAGRLACCTPSSHRAIKPCQAIALSPSRRRSCLMLSLSIAMGSCRHQPPRPASPVLLRTGSVHALAGRPRASLCDGR